MSSVAEEPTVEEHLGPYRLTRRLGQGGMGVVYLAAGPDDRKVAVKVLRPHVAYDETARARLEREVSTLQRVNHPGVAGILDHDLHASRPYLVTRYVDGPGLDQVIEERGPLTPKRWLQVAGCLAESLQALHARGIVHRDLKPGNVLIDDDGRPVLIDFGIAQAADDLRLTATGLVIGTPGYLAPELVEGGAVTTSTDWWGWAATMTFAVTGRRPFGRGPFEAVLHRVHTGKVDLDGVDPRLEPLLRAALSPKRAERPNATEILAGLGRYAEGRAALDRPVPHPVVVPAAETVVQTRVLDDSGPAPKVTPEMVAQLVPAVLPSRESLGELRSHLRKLKPPAAAAPVLQPPATTPPALQPANYQPTPPVPYHQPAPPVPYQAAGTYHVAPPPAAAQPAVRPLQPTRSWSLFAALVCLVGLAVLLPMLAALVAALAMVLARAVDRASTALLRRREARGGRGRTDGLIATVASPVHLLTAALITLPCLILPLITATSIGGLTALGLGVVQGFSWQPLTPIAVATGTAIGLFTTWWGPGGTSLRRGSRTLVRKTLRPVWLNAPVVVVLLATGAFCLLSGLGGSEPDWTPLSNPVDRTEIPEPNLRDLLPDLPKIGF